MHGYLDFLLSLVTLTFLEVVLCIDNLIFISLISSRLPRHQQRFARTVGLLLAIFTRLLFLSFIRYLTYFVAPVIGHFSVRDILFIGGGMYLIWHSSKEIFHKTETKEKPGKWKIPHNRFAVIAQIVFLDIIFSFDSVFTAVGMAQSFVVMAIAIILSILIMLFAMEFISKFLKKYPSFEILALSFLILIGTVLIIDGFQYHVPRAYIYFAIGFSLFVESINIWLKSKSR